MTCIRCDKVVASPLFALGRKEREARQEGFCTYKCRTRDDLFRELADPYWWDADAAATP